ncbi:MAG: trehalose-6-phosphate synthase [Gaiellaceae bacterium]
MTGRRQLIVVSNRGPVSYGRGEDGKRVVRRGGGGLVTALRSLVSLHDVTWIASAMSAEDRVAAAEAGPEAVDEVARDGSRYRLRLVAHEPEAYHLYYHVVANPMLWFLQHYLWDLAHAPELDHELHRAWNEGYVAVNAAFAEAVLAELDAAPEACVFFHDYHLYLAPRIVREQRPDAMLAHFVHIPWAQPDYWRVLPEPIRRAVHDGLLANDVVGFHTGRWRRNFMRSSEELVGAECEEGGAWVDYEGRLARVTACPISVDPGEFEELAGSEAVLARERELLALHGGRRIVLRVDRTDLSKNVLRGFRAFELYLEAHPEMHAAVVMLALLDPSRQDIPQYSEYLQAIHRTADAVNARFGRGDWLPIDLRIADDFPQSVAAYKLYDALLVNAIFDGMNLVAKEAPLVNERDGVLILSENAGAHEELGEWALTVNPFDVAGQAAAIHEALELPRPERWRRLQALRAHVHEHDLDGWIAAQLAAVDECRADAREYHR